MCSKTQQRHSCRVSAGVLMQIQGKLLRLHGSIKVQPLLCARSPQALCPCLKYFPRVRKNDSVMESGLFRCSDFNPLSQVVTRKHASEAKRDGDGSSRRLFWPRLAVCTCFVHGDSRCKEMDVQQCSLFTWLVFINPRVYRWDICVVSLSKLSPDFETQNSSLLFVVLNLTPISTNNPTQILNGTEINE